MSTTQQAIAGITGFILIGVYSWIMIAASGSAGWAWIILAAGIVVLVSTARSVATARTERHDA